MKVLVVLNKDFDVSDASNCHDRKLHCSFHVLYAVLPTHSDLHRVALLTSRNLNDINHGTGPEI
jgi:hypothetical protein